MRVLIFHGYLLDGTGSNVYTASLARALARLGHDVHLLCQQRDLAGIDWIDAAGSWEQGSLTVRPLDGAGSAGEGTVTVYRPEIGGLLPVYVADRYEGFRVKTFPALSDDELDRYLADNVGAVHDVVGHAGGVDAALANHLVMGPAILARAGLGFVAKVHGSALSYTVRPHPRFLPYAREGMAAASAVLVGSGHSARSLFETIRNAELEAKTRLGPPGVDTDAFAPPVPGTDPAERLAALAEHMPTGVSGADSFARDGDEAARALRAYAAASGPRVLFVGKLIVSKGCDLLLAAWPRVAAGHPGARLLIAGFGAYREALERLWGAFVAGDLETARGIASRGRELEGGPAGPLRMLAELLADPPAGWAEAAAAAAGSVEFAGRLEHAEVAAALAASDAMVVPSTFPESFGMVAAEAAAAGVLPVCAGHSGLAEVAAALDAELPAAARGLTSYPPEDDPIAAIAARLNAWLGLDPGVRDAARATLRRTVERRWSWERVARGVLAASAGELDSLDPVPLSESVPDRKPRRRRPPPSTQ